MTEKVAGSMTERIPVPLGRKERVTNWMDRNMAFLFNIPTVLFLGGMVAFPATLVLWTSLTDWQLISKESANFIWFDNYFTMWADERWIRGLFNTFYFAILSVTGQLVLGMGTAMVFNRNFTGKSFYRSIWMMPMTGMSVPRYQNQPTGM